MYKYLLLKIKEYIFIFLTATTFFLSSSVETFSQENVFIIDKVKIEGVLDVNFNRDKYLNKAFMKSFTILMSKVLLSKDFKKINNIKLKKVKNLIDSFQILEENYQNDIYKLTLKISYNDTKIKRFLENNNISFSQPENISVIFFPILFHDDEIKDFSENFFYKKWEDVEIENKIVNFILPLDDLDDVSKLREAKKKIEEINANDFVNKYDVRSYVFALMSFQNQKLNVHLKVNFNNSEISKNISYKINDIENESELTIILKDLKMIITDIWKEENVINLSSELSLRVKFKFENFKDLEHLKNTFFKVSIINKYSLEQLNVNNAFFTIYYYGNPKRLQNELSKFNYKLKNDQLYWTLYKND